MLQLQSAVVVDVTKYENPLMILLTEKEPPATLGTLKTISARHRPPRDGRNASLPQSRKSLNMVSVNARIRGASRCVCLTIECSATFTAKRLASSVAHHVWPAPRFRCPRDFQGRLRCLSPGSPSSCSASTRDLCGRLTLCLCSFSAFRGVSTGNCLSFCALFAVLFSMISSEVLSMTKCVFFHEFTRNGN